MQGRRSVVALAAVALFGLAGECEPPTVERSPVQPGETGTGTEPEAETAGVGDSLRLSGTEEGLEMEVTVLKVVDPAKPESEFFGAAKGKRLVAVQLRLANVGSIVYEDSPSNGAVVIDRDDQQYEASLFDAVEPALGSPRIRRGDKRVGFITFEIPKRAKLRTFQLTLDSGFGPETGEWNL